MAKKKGEFLTGITNLLPEGLDESTLEKIAQLISDRINEEVTNQNKTLVTKVTSFIRGNIEKLKEQALKELELENETFRNAQMFETVRSMFAVENTADDDISGMNVLASIGESQEQKILALTSELDKVLKENVQLKRAGKVLSEQVNVLKESVVTLNESVTKKTSTKKMSDSAVVVSEQNFKVKDNIEKTVKQEQAGPVNEWLTPNILAAAKKLKESK